MKKQKKLLSEPTIELRKKEFNFNEVEILCSKIQEKVGTHPKHPQTILGFIHLLHSEYERAHNLVYSTSSKREIRNTKIFYKEYILMALYLFNKERLMSEVRTLGLKEEDSKLVTDFINQCLKLSKEISEELMNLEKQRLIISGHGMTSPMLSILMIVERYSLMSHFPSKGEVYKRFHEVAVTKNRTRPYFNECCKKLIKNGWMIEWSYGSGAENGVFGVPGSKVRGKSGRPKEYLLPTKKTTDKFLLPVLEWVGFIKNS